MVRWITFDRASALAAHAASQFIPELHDTGDALPAALSSARDSVVVMAAPTPGLAVVAQIRHAPATEVLPRPVAYEAGGFLGLIDHPIYEEEPPKPKKWWQKLLD